MQFDIMIKTIDGGIKVYEDKKYDSEERLVEYLKNHNRVKAFLYVERKHSDTYNL